MWLSGSSYHLYQYMLQVADEDVGAMLRYLTFLPLEEISNVIEKHTVSGSWVFSQKWSYYFPCPSPLPFLLTPLSPSPFPPPLVL